MRIDNTWRTIVGVHRNYVYRDPTQPVRPTVLLPMTQDYNSDAIVVVRSKNDPSLLLPSLRQIVREYDRNIPLAHVMTMEDNVGFHFVEVKAGTTALTIFALVACVLAAIGIYAVLEGFIHQRRREFGIRIAVGAIPSDVRKRVMAESALMALIGSGIGLLLCLALGQLLRSALFTLSPLDPRPYAVAALVMGMTVLLSTLTPAWSASRMDPIAALRSE